MVELREDFLVKDEEQASFVMPFRELFDALVEEGRAIDDYTVEIMPGEFLIDNGDGEWTVEKDGESVTYTEGEKFIEDCMPSDPAIQDDYWYFRAMYHDYSEPYFLFPTELINELVPEDHQG